MKRIITGLVLLTIGIWVVLKGDWWLFFWVLVVGNLAFYEISTITNLKSKFLMVANMAIYSYLIFLLSTRFMNSKIIMGLCVCIVLFYMISLTEYVRGKLLFNRYWFLNNLKFFLYVFLGFGTVILIRKEPQGLTYLLILFISIWASDIFALYGGRMFGKRQLSKISPKKTIEGTICGVLSAVLIIVGCVYAFQWPWVYAVIAILVSFWAQLGDLYESLIKRVYHVKDSSNLLPGHGGILDRADSSLFVFPLAYFLIQLFL